MNITEELEMLTKLIKNKGSCGGIFNLNCPYCLVYMKLKSCAEIKTVRLMAKERKEELKEELKKLEYLEKL